MQNKIALCGKMRAGKDTVADLISSHFPNMKRYTFGSGIKKVIEICFPEALEGEGKPRQHYQVVGQELRKLNEDVWINYTFRQMKDTTNDIIVTDCRQFNEAKRLREEGFVIIKVIADDEVRMGRIAYSGDVFLPEQFYHDTELQVDTILPDYILINNGTPEDLEIELRNFYNYYDNYTIPHKKYDQLRKERGINEQNSRF